MYPDGTLVRGPKALCELQGYVYDAWLRMAEIYDELTTNGAQTHCAKRRRYCQEIQRGFWTRRPASTHSLWTGQEKVLSVASNVGQCLWSGIIAPDALGPW